MISCQSHDQRGISSVVTQEAQAHFLELIKEGYLETVHVSADWTRCWMILEVEDREFAKNLIKTSPLYDLMLSEIDELAKPY